MDFINSWKSKSKKWDRLAVKVRIGKLTILDIYINASTKQAGISLFNIGVKTKSNPSKINKTWQRK